ncbi:Acyl carrier protein [Labilithrix luteola]|uniref:Acyl carrier protein n=1 Tax=Labilithrix luteola TaxID=1391654 RepID=A0A0K1PPN9_9BACT|nr:phosphopantetheine-binding protein [Labilithrix luteola]AKU95089.1 Acyl carrier protein [Labilithrix luteola]
MSVASNENTNDTLALVVDTIRDVVAEDWIKDYEINRETRFSRDMELDSLEFVRIVDAIQVAVGSQIDVMEWLSGKTIPALIELRVGDIVDVIDAAKQTS